MRGKQKLVVVVGPTASGKSDLAVKIAKRFNGEIISADSRQVYRGMNIGTAKPNKREMTIVKHHLIDIRNPNQDYSAGQYKKDAIRAINRIIKSGKLPILVGGTGLYIDAVVKNLDFPKIKENKKLRARLEKEIKERGLDYVFKKLVALDPEAAYIVDPKNPRRIIRALEVALLSGRKFSEQRKTGRPLYDALEIGLRVPPEKLKKRIAKRINKMINPPTGGGLIGEAKKLIKKYGPNCKTLDAIGYREIIDYLKGKISLAKAIEQINKNTWHYAKRQMTWFRKNGNIRWIKNKDEAVKLVSVFLKN